MTTSCKFNMGCLGGDCNGGGVAILLLLSVCVGVLFFLFNAFLSLWRNLIKGAWKEKGKADGVLISCEFLFKNKADGF